MPENEQEQTLDNGGQRRQFRAGEDSHDAARSMAWAGPGPNANSSTGRARAGPGPGAVQSRTSRADQGKVAPEPSKGTV